MRKTITTLCTLLSLAGCSPQYVKVNPSPDAPIIKRDERSLITDLRQQVLEAEAEDAWLYTPETQECHDIGLKTEEEEGKAMTVDYDLDKIRQIAHKHRRLHFYHIHPIKPFERIIMPYLTSPPKGYTPQRVRELLEKDNVVPSHVDIGSAISFSCLFQHHQEKDVRHYVVSRYGITEYKPNVKELLDFCELVEEKETFSQGTILGEHAYNQIDPKVLEWRVNEAIKRKKPVHLLKNSFLRITFHPYESITQ